LNQQHSAPKNPFAAGSSLNHQMETNQIQPSLSHMSAANVLNQQLPASVNTLNVNNTGGGFPGLGNSNFATNSILPLQSGGGLNPLQANTTGGSSFVTNTSFGLNGLQNQSTGGFPNAQKNPNRPINPFNG
jgi:hypothetical protein